jgi:hypothetical protein
VPAPASFGSTFGPVLAYVGTQSSPTFALVADGMYWNITASAAGSATWICRDSQFSGGSRQGNVANVMASWGQNLVGGASFQLTAPLSATPPPFITLAQYEANIAALNSVITALIEKAVDFVNVFTSETDGYVLSGGLSETYLWMPSGNALSSAGANKTALMVSYGSERSGGNITGYSYLCGGEIAAPVVQPVSVVVSGRRSVSLGAQPDLSGTLSLSLMPLQDVGWIIGPGNPSCVDCESVGVPGCSAVADADIDLQDGQAVFTPVGTVFTGTGGGY